MGKKSVEQLLKAYLREGEQVLWHGRTEPFGLLDNDARFQILGKWIGTLVAAGAILALYLGNSSNASTGGAALIVLVAVLLVASPFIERYSLVRQEYWLTDQRAILMARDQSFYYMELMDIDDFHLIQGKAAQDCLVLGSTLFEEERQLRWRACHPKLDMQNADDADMALGLVFYGVKNGQGAADLLRRWSGKRAA